MYFFINASWMDLYLVILDVSHSASVSSFDVLKSWILQAWLITITAAIATCKQENLLDCTILSVNQSDLKKRAYNNLQSQSVQAP